MKKGLIILIIIILISLFIILYKIARKNNKNDNDSKYSKELQKLLKKEVNHDKLIKVSYSCSGDMNGNIDTIDIDIQELILKTRYSEGVGIPVQVKEYKITKENVEKIIELIEKDNFVAWDGLPLDSEHIALDAPSKHITLTYDNSNIGLEKLKWYNISYDTQIPQDGYKLLNEFTNYIFSLKIDDNLINTYIEKDND